VELMSTQSLTQMSTKRTSWGVKAAGARADNLGNFIYRFSRNSEKLNLLEPSGRLQVCIAIALPFLKPVISNALKNICYGPTACY